MDNAGKNRALEDACIEKDLGIVFEYTAPGTPQQNGVVKRAFLTMLGKTRAIMNGAGFDGKKRHLFWTEATNTVTHLENIWKIGNCQSVKCDKQTQRQRNEGNICRLRQ